VIFAKKLLAFLWIVKMVVHVQSMVQFSRVLVIVNIQELIVRQKSAMIMNVSSMEFAIPTMERTLVCVQKDILETSARKIPVLFHRVLRTQSAPTNRKILSALVKMDFPETIVRLKSASMINVKMALNAKGSESLKHALANPDLMVSIAKMKFVLKIFVKTVNVSETVLTKHAYAKRDGSDHFVHQTIHVLSTSALAEIRSAF
jgi:hypothetical protein